MGTVLTPRDVMRAGVDLLAMGQRRSGEEGCELVWSTPNIAAGVCNHCLHLPLPMGVGLWHAASGRKWLYCPSRSSLGCANPFARTNHRRICRNGTELRASRLRRSPWPSRRPELVAIRGVFCSGGRRDSLTQPVRGCRRCARRGLDRFLPLFHAPAHRLC